MKGLFYTVLVTLAVAPLFYSNPPSMHCALSPYLFGRYCMFYTAAWLFYLTLLLPIGVELAHKLFKLAVFKHAFLRRIRRVSFFTWFTILSAAILLEVFLHIEVSMIPGSVMARLPGQGRYLTKGVTGWRIADSEVVYTLASGKSALIEPSAMNGDLTAVGIAHPNKEERNTLDVAPAYTLQLDKKGFRGISGGAEQRILFLGDSFVYCGRTATDDIWCSKAAKTLNVACVNLGMPEYSVPEEMVLLTRHLEYYHPGLVVLCVFEGNDLADAQYWRDWRDSKMPHWKWEVRDASITRSVVLTAMGVVFERLFSFTMPGSVGFDAPVAMQPFRGELFGHDTTLAFAPRYLRMLEAGPVEIRSHPGYAPTWEAIIAARDFCRERQCGFVLALLPSKASVYGWHLLEQVTPQEVVRSAGLIPPTAQRGADFLDAAHMHRNALAAVLSRDASGESIPFIDFRPAFFKAAIEGGAQTYSAFDTHWNKEGQVLAAKVLVDYLKSQPELLPE
jgi:hypothetical protein